MKFINSGYRMNFKGPLDYIKSLFWIHNEFVNTWTHLIGSLLALFIGIYIIFSYDKSYNYIIL